MFRNASGREVLRDPSLRESKRLKHALHYSFPQASTEFIAT